MTANETENRTIELERVQDITPHNKALYEAGKKLLVDSVDVGREFCKFMTTTTLGAIPAYLALLKLVLPKDYSLHSYDEVLFLAPPMIFLASAALFVLGYFPQKGNRYKFTLSAFHKNLINHLIIIAFILIDFVMQQYPPCALFIITIPAFPQKFEQVRDSHPLLRPIFSRQKIHFP